MGTTKTRYVGAQHTGIMGHGEFLRGRREQNPNFRGGPTPWRGAAPPP